MVERDGWKPRNKEAAFHAGEQGGNNLGGEEHCSSGNPAFGESAKAIDVVGQRLIERIGGIEHDKLTEVEFTKGRYYRYSIAVSLRGMSREEFLSANPVHKEDEMLYLEAGAKEAALDFLQDFPDDLTAVDVGLRGMEASDEVHQRFYAKGLGRNIIQFIRKHNP